MIIPAPRASDPLLVVEGQNDLHVIRHIAERSHPALEFGIRQYEGVDNVLNSISDHIDAPSRPAVGFVMDTDQDSIQIWRRIRSEFLKASRIVSLPDRPDPDGTVIPGDWDAGVPSVGIWLMPNNQAAGELEDFVAQMIPAGDPVWPLAQDYIAGIPLSARKFADGKTLRAQLHSWLAAREDPRQMGLAIRARDLAVDSELCRKFTAWLTRLFT